MLYRPAFPPCLLLTGRAGFEHREPGSMSGKWAGANLTVLAALAGASAFSGASPARAEEDSGPVIATAELTDFDFHRAGNTPVADRPHPEWDPRGVRAGGFLVFPKVTLSADFDDNIYASPSKNSLPGFPVT